MTRDVEIGRSTTTRPAAWSATRLVAQVERWMERRRQRHALWQMSDAMLKDIGLNRYEAWEESRKWFWRR